MTTIDTTRLRELVEKASSEEGIDVDDFIGPVIDALPALLDAFDEREKLRRALSLAVSRGCDHCSESIGEARKIAHECGV
jgi:hypothetical protein